MRDVSSRLTRRQLVTGSLAAAGLTALPWRVARGYPIYQRGTGMKTVYKALSPVPMVTATRSVAGYRPTLASVYAQLLQPGAPKPLTTDPYQAALQLVARPWFHALGSGDPLVPPPPKVTRHTQFDWHDTHPSAGFHPVLQPVRRTKLVKATVSDRKKFGKRARVQTERICLAMLFRLPLNRHSTDELSAGIRSLIQRTTTVEYTLVSDARPWIVPATAHAEFEPPSPPAAPALGSSLASTDYFPDPPNYADETTTHTAIELAAAAAAFGEAAAVMGKGVIALKNAMHEAAALRNTAGVLSALGLSIVLGFSGAVLGVLSITLFYMVVTARPRADPADKTWDTFVEMSPFGSGGAGCGACIDMSGVTQTTVPAISQVGLTLGLVGITADGQLIDTQGNPIGPVATVPSDDAGPAPGIGDPNDPGNDDGGLF